jgi:hypothetical protein
MGRCRMTYGMCSPSHILIPARNNEVELLASVNAIRNRHFMVPQRNLDQKPPERKCPAQYGSDTDPGAQRE